MTPPVGSELPHEHAAREQWINDIAFAMMGLNERNDASAITGVSGATLFLTHLSQLTGRAEHRNALLECATRSKEIVASLPMGSALYGGIAGMVWPLAHLDRLGLDDQATDLGDIDDLLIASLEADAISKYDLISGAVGLGVYFLERMPAPAAIEGLRAVTRQLATTGERDGRGLRWLTSVEMIPADQHEKWPAGRYDLGVAHGVPGVIAFLALALLEGFDHEPAEGMLRDAVRWLLTLQRPDARMGAFATMIDARENAPPPMTSRAAWCYGDPGIAMAVFLASLALNDGKMRESAHAMARNSAILADSERRRVFDMSLCHGSAGLAHLFGVFGEVFRDHDLRTRSGEWHRETLAMRRQGEGVAGVYFCRFDDGIRRNVPDPSFLQGAAGVGLSLLRTLDPAADRSWDRLLLLS